ncbi:MAG TPA: S-adenosylmethionine:tRNA ribosyltransferase-isomerase, partial [Chitinophagaceae bacterium]|nr:S-adenosylmethionine:tRNA ribosyltransferase-isomerase [Chitinophagaceae bacterium]
AAPTAGLHFTNTVLKKLKERNIDTDFVTLHVGAGTFKPVKTELMKDHEMHAEHFTISKSTIQNILDHLDKSIIAVGTTSLRTLESLYWLGAKQSTVNNQQSIEITQWEVYDHKEKMIPTKKALENLLRWMDENKSNTLTAKTQIIIAPGYQFKIVNGLITNFHQPLSTLLLLVAAFIGNNWRKVYEYAFENDFRFLSYGDGSLLWRNS